MKSFAQSLLTIRTTDEDMRRRGRMIATLALGMIIFGTLSVPLALLGPTPLTSVANLTTGTTSFIMTLVLVRRGRITVSGMLLIGMVLVGVLISMIGSPNPLPSIAFLVLPILLASLILRPAYVWLVLVLVFVGIAGLAPFMPAKVVLDINNPPLALGGIALLGSVALLSFLGGRATASAFAEARAARASAELLASELAQANAGLEQRVAERTAALHEAIALLEARTAEQEQLIAENELQRTTIREMSLPTIPINRRTMVMPLIGALDSARLQELQVQALRAIERTSTRHLVLDITGIIVVDSQVARGVLDVVQAARLLGSEVILVGVRPEVAQALLGMGLYLPIRTFRDLESVLRYLDEEQVEATQAIG